MEEALEQVGVLDLVLQLVEDLDLAVDQGLQPPGEVDEDLDLLFVARGAEELGRLDDGGDRGVLGAPQFLGEEVEGVAVGGGGGGGRRGPTGSPVRSCSTTRWSSAWPWALARRSVSARSSTAPATRWAPR
ncbi:hypothetical protein ACN24L_35855 [Streptomyces microflavus]